MISRYLKIITEKISLFDTHAHELYQNDKSNTCKYFMDHISPSFHTDKGASVFDSIIMQQYRNSGLQRSVTSMRFIENVTFSLVSSSSKQRNSSRSACSRRSWSCSSSCVARSWAF